MGWREDPSDLGLREGPGGGMGGEPNSPIASSGSPTDWRAQDPFTGNLGEIQEQKGGLHFTNEETGTQRG